MAAVLGGDEEEKDLLTCGICMEYYDTNNHIPKLLECFHSCCIACMKSQAVNSTVTCPFCRKETKISKGVENLTSNFYILPRVKKMEQERKHLANTIAKTKENWAKSIAMRREVLEKFKMVQDSLRIIENTVAKKTEANNEKIAILQSLLEDSVAKADGDEMLTLTKLYEDYHEQSAKELKETEALYASISDIEKFLCCLVLKNQSDSACYHIKSMQNKALTFHNKSSKGPHIGAFNSILAFMLFSLKEKEMWNQSLENGAYGEACAVLSNGKRNGGSSFSSASSSDESSDAESESSFEETAKFCYMRFKIDGTLTPKVVFRLNFEEAPIMSAMFRGYCDGSNSWTYKDTPIFMVTRGDSFTGGKFNDLNSVGSYCSEHASLLRRPCERYVADRSTLDEVKGAIRMRHRGRCENGVYVSSEFSVLCRDHSVGNQMTTVFGYVYQGMEVCERISQLPSTTDIVIDSCGIWYSGII